MPGEEVWLDEAVASAGEGLAQFELSLEEMYAGAGSGGCAEVSTSMTGGLRPPIEYKASSSLEAMLLTPRIGAASGAELGEGPSEEARIRRLAFPRRLHAVACSPMWPAVCFAADGQALAVATDGNFGPLTSRSALVRRLSDYGFRKQRGVDEWRHPAFNAAEPDFAAIVRRGVRQGSAEAASAGDVAVAADATECDALRRSLVRG
ncbi:uncharacterized protein AMSG_10881 [Thecamonas trahens ATCC 50062]|uniref:HSF-type DNA-binding domain-containing protein n=1 Tax=Thecamonas trahens ATCC 50062 TaxID=461836 RepID=A0A0L0DSR0_THETB|nr:hypothetical protein AMSG_10881 [Thecamonas trahens ATCC 50062]KNC55247.1 hypothetical protein AMSG_10881 [Thecamonas trahens ATCC 50062]|eukprot:XP_013753176.1 hypothetical protein AMSG_10881 [Thecamonas trahens ATCC 50062]